MRAALALAASLGAAFTLPAAAGASTAALDGGVLRVTGTAGVDALTVFADGADLIVRDGFTPTTAGPGCSATAVAWAACPLAAVARVEVDLGGGDDVIVVRPPRPLVVHGGAGDDALLAGAAPQGVTLDGGPGDDRMTGGQYADILLGGPGADGLDGAYGDDIVDPGPGRDAVADEQGADAFVAADGEPDAIDCGPGADRGTFDVADRTRGCEGAPGAPPTDCTPEIAPPTAADARRLLRGAALRLDVAVAAGCTATVTLLVGGVTYARAAAAPGGMTLRPSRAGRRALRRHRSAVVRVVVRSPSGAVVRRRLTLAS